MMMSLTAFDQMIPDTLKLLYSVTNKIILPECFQIIPY